MLLKRNVLMVLFLAMALSVKAFYANNGILGIFLGYEQNKGYSFSVSEGLRAKVITFGEIEDSTLLSKYNLKDDVSLVGSSFNITYETGLNKHTGAVELKLVTLEKTELPDTLLEKHN